MIGQVSWEYDTNTRVRLLVSLGEWTVEATRRGGLVWSADLWREGEFAGHTAWQVVDVPTLTLHCLRWIADEVQQSDPTPGASMLWLVELFAEVNA